MAGNDQKPLITNSFSSGTKISYQSTAKDPVSHAVSLTEHEQVTLTWRNINVYAPVKTKRTFGEFFKRREQSKKHILRQVSGKAEPGCLLAILGASGAGKSTLLNVLTYRNRGNLTVVGDVLVNGAALSRDITSISAYVQQDDLFIGTLKVSEHLYFQSILRMDSHLSKSRRMEKVEEVIRELGLEKCSNTLIGIPGRLKGISSGERKRLAFASEVLTNPRLLFLDEPTSGLDSFMAGNIIQVLKSLASCGRTILCTIHQPSSQVFAMFDHLLLMADGRTAYLGPAKDATLFLSGLNYECPPNYNPADFLIYTLAIVPEQEDKTRVNVESICDAYERTEQYKSLLVTNQSIPHLLPLGSSKGSSSPYKASWAKQFAALMCRSWLNVMRDPMLIKVRTFHTVLVAVILGLVFLDTDLTQEGIQDINGLMFLLLTNMTFWNMFAVINVFCGELSIFLREHYNGMYRTDVYFISKSLAEVPLFIFLPVIFTTICYWMVGLYNDWKAFLICCLIVTLVGNVSVSFGYMISCMANNVTLALSIAPPFVVPFMLFGGYFLNANSVPVYFIWLEYLSWFKYAYEAMSINQWKDVTSIECTDTVELCVRNGTQVLATLNFNESNLWLDIILLGALLIGYRLVGFISLLIRASMMRGK